MRKMFLSLWLSTAALALAACGSGGQAVPTEAVATPARPPTGTSPPTQIAAASPTAQPGCTVVSLLPTPDPSESSPFPPVEAGDWVQGSDAAAVTIIEYSDFQ